MTVCVFLLEKASVIPGQLCLEFYSDTLLLLISHLRLQRIEISQHSCLYPKYG